MPIPSNLSQISEILSRDPLPAKILDGNGEWAGSSDLASFPSPGVVVSPSDGEVGSKVTVGGSYFNPYSSYTAHWDSSIQVCAGTTNALGNFTCGFYVPTAVAGQHTVSGEQGSNSAETTYTVTPSLMLSRAQGAAGITIVATGAGYHASNASDPIDFQMWWSKSVLLCEGNTTSTGNLSCSFAIPRAPYGSYPITVNDTADPAVTVFFTIPGPSLGLPVWVLWTVVASIVVAAVLGSFFVARELRRSGRAPKSGTIPRSSTARLRRRSRKGGPSTPRASSQVHVAPFTLGPELSRSATPPQEGFSDPSQPGVFYARIRKHRRDLEPGDMVVADAEPESSNGDAPR